MANNATTLRVELGERSYNIVVGSGLLEHADKYIKPLLASKHVIVMSDRNVAPRYGKQLQETLNAAGLKADAVTVRSGEASKDYRTFERVMESLLELNPDRKTTIIALGGGVVGDLAGFAASVLLRGVPFIQIPTSLLAQVDSSVGGKTAINAKKGKNLIGTFYQPKLVLIDTDTLQTLPPRELRAGYAEIIKYGLIMDAEFYQWCLKNGAGVLSGDPALIQHAILKSCECKAAIVKEDERESDKRALLNFGHTFAHALEAEMGFSPRLLHGEAVAIGMVMACRLSHHMKLITSDVETQLASHLMTLGLMTQPRDVTGMLWDTKRIAAHFAKDKKAEDGKLTFVVLDSIGHAKVTKSVNPILARDVVDSFLVKKSSGGNAVL